MTYHIHTGDCREHMRDAIPAGSVQAVVSSPPYWGGIRDYQIPTLTWGDGWSGDYGNEPTIEMYLAHTLEIFDGLRRVLRDDGVIFWNVGDTYSSGTRSSFDNITNNKGNKASHNAPRTPNRELPEGNKCLIPHRVAIALQDAGWIVRQDIVWRKPSPMPESVNGVRWERCRVKVGSKSERAGQSYKGSTPDKNGKLNRDCIGGEWVGGPVWQDCPGCHKCEANDGYVLRRGSWRTTNAHEYIFMITKSQQYFCDADAVKEPTSGNAHSRGQGVNPKSAQGTIGNERQNGSFSAAVKDVVETRNPRSVWTIPNEPYKGKHFAAFPSTLPYKCLQAAVSQFGCCNQCGACYAPIVERERKATRPGNDSKVNGITLDADSPYQAHAGTIAGNRDPQRHTTVTNAIGHRKTCSCQDSQPVPCTVYDPFSGSGTTVQVAHWMGLNAIGSELGEQYLPLIHGRVKSKPKCFPAEKNFAKADLPGQQELFN